VWSKIGLKQVWIRGRKVATLRFLPQRPVISISPGGSKQTLKKSINYDHYLTYY
jgi:hypothetical protein